MKKKIGTLSLVAMVFAMATAIISTSPSSAQTAKDNIGIWIKYDCHRYNSQPVIVTLGVNYIMSDANPYSLIDCPDEIGKCAVKFDFYNVEQIPDQPQGNLRPKNPYQEVALIRCGE